MQTGKPLKVFEFSENENLVHFEEIEKLFENPKVKNRKVVILSIVGLYRLGKSFFLNYCLRYLYANYESINGSNSVKKSNWLDDNYSGFEEDTNGILFWSDVFLHNDLAIFIADTQGLFVHDTILCENAKVFCLSSIFSSIQIINLTRNNRKDGSQYVSFGEDFAKYVKQYQKVVFLFRDWQCECQKNFQNMLKGKSIEEELKSVQNFLLTSCEDCECFMLPHPGKNVTGEKDKSIDDHFKNGIKKTVESLLSPENLIPKKVAGKELTAEEYLPHMRQYFEFFALKEKPRVANLFESMIKMELDRLIEKYLKVYNSEVENLQKTIEKKHEISVIHGKAKSQVLNDFNNAEKLGCEQQAKDAERLLTSKIDESFKLWDEKLTNRLDKEETQEKNEEEIKELKNSFEAEKKLLLEKIEDAYKLCNDTEEVYKKNEAKLNELNNSLEAEKKLLSERVEALEAELENEKIIKIGLNQMIGKHLKNYNTILEKNENCLMDENANNDFINTDELGSEQQAKSKAEKSGIENKIDQLDNEETQKKNEEKLEESKKDDNYKGHFLFNSSSNEEFPKIFEPSSKESRFSSTSTPSQVQYSKNPLRSQRRKK